MANTEEAAPARKGRPFELGKVEVVRGWRYLVFWPVAILARLYLATLRLRVDPAELARLREAAGPKTIVKWHGLSLIAPRLLQKYFRIEKAATLISASARGAYQARWYEWYGMRVERGSVSRRGLHALRALARLQGEGFDVVLSPDGPSGPRHAFRGGAALLARKSGGPIVCVSAECPLAWRAGTWDRHFAPLPFAKVTARIQVLDSYASHGWRDDEEAAAALRAALLRLAPEI